MDLVPKKKPFTVHIGEVGVHAVLKDILSNYDYQVYRPVVDERGVDLIVERRKKEFLRVQVKTITDMKTDTSIEIRLHKYVKKDLIDVVAVYYMEKDMVAYCMYNDEASINLALKPSRNNQNKKRRYFYALMEFPIV